MNMEEAAAIDSIARGDNIIIPRISHGEWRETRLRYFAIYADQMNKLDMHEHFTISEWPIPRCPPSITVKVCRCNNGFILATILGEQIIHTIAIKWEKWIELTMNEQVCNLTEAVNEVVEPMRAGCS